MYQLIMIVSISKIIIVREAKNGNIIHLRNGCYKDVITSFLSSEPNLWGTFQVLKTHIYTHFNEVIRKIYLVIKSTQLFP